MLTPQIKFAKTRRIPLVQNAATRNNGSLPSSPLWTKDRFELRLDDTTCINKLSAELRIT